MYIYIHIIIRLMTKKKKSLPMKKIMKKIKEKLKKIKKEKARRWKSRYINKYIYEYVCMCMRVHMEEYVYIFVSIDEYLWIHI
jgi:hypothetical protein